MLMLALTFVVSAQFENVPLEWTCSPFQYGSGDGCDCGCGAADPDCGDLVGDELRASCLNDGCGADRVPNRGDPTRCVANVCGDGYAAGEELCDDGEAGAADGCSSDCSRISPGFRCSKRGGGCNEPGCGDRVVEVNRGEDCDDGNDDAGDGCNACVAEDGFVCFTFAPCQPTTCGNGNVEVDFETLTGEGCDDGNANPDDGCDRCVVSPGFICNPFELNCIRVECGNGVVERDFLGRGEGCDDSNLTGGDGCSAVCAVEDGFSCERGFCEPLVCGDGVRLFPEACDDANAVTGDGCSSDCTAVDPGFACPREGGLCHAVVCGDGVAEGDDAGTTFEECDDNNTDDGDGCDRNCRREAGAICLPDGSCHLQVCGDGLVDLPNFGGSESCDDGNANDGDGCSGDCTFVEGNFFCPVPGEACIEPECGDAVVEGGESCDDGNDDAGDGCGDECRREDNFVCREPGTPCEPLPAAWTCATFFYSDGDCDCGCGTADPDCPVGDDASDCDFNQCAQSAPFVDSSDPTQCTTTPPVPSEGEGEGNGEGEGEANGDDGPSLGGGGCGGCAAAPGLPLASMLLLLLRRRRR